MLSTDGNSFNSLSGLYKKAKFCGSNYIDSPSSKPEIRMAERKKIARRQRTCRKGRASCEKIGLLYKHKELCSKEVGDHWRQLGKPIFSKVAHTVRKSLQKSKKKGQCYKRFVQGVGCTPHKLNQANIIHQCTSCKTTFNDSEDLDIHNLLHHKTKDCSVVLNRIETNQVCTRAECSKNLSTVSSFDKQLASHEEEVIANIHTKICSYKHLKDTETRNSTSAQKKCVPALASDLFPNSLLSARPVYRCTKLLKKLVPSSYLKPHQRVSKPLFYLKHCHKVFSSQSSLEAHEDMHFLEEPEGNRNFNVYHCPDCHKVFSSQSSLEAHEDMHLLDDYDGYRNFNVFHCPDCYRWFGSKEHLVDHRCILNQVL